MLKKKVAELQMHEGRQELAKEIEKWEALMKADIMNPDLEIREKANEKVFNRNDLYVIVVNLLENIRNKPENVNSKTKYDLKKKRWNVTQVSDE